MKKESPLWSSISLLIGIVIAILALIRGRMLLPPAAGGVCPLAAVVALDAGSSALAQ